MAIDFSQLQGTPAHTGQLDFSALGGVPAVGQDEPTDDTTALGAAGRGAAGMIPLGTQAYAATAGLAENKPYIKEREELEKEIEADKENHGVARLAGQAAGLVAPALLTGGASAPESLAGAAGEGALVGAGFGTGNAIDTLAGGGSGAKAAGDVALGTALGAAGGAAGQKIAGALNKTIPGIENYASKKAAAAVGLGSDELGNMTQPEVLATGKRLMDLGILKPGASTQEMFDTAKGIHEAYGQKIGEIGDKAGQLGLTTDVKPLLKNLEEKFNAADALANPDERKAAIFYKKGMADILTMARQNLPENLADVQGAPVPNDITFAQLQRLKKSYGNSAFENGAVKNAAAADVYGQLGAGQRAIIEKVRANPDLPNELKDAMSGYAELHPVVKGLQDVLGRERAGNMPSKGFGMMGKLVGQMPGQQNPAINVLTSLGLIGAGHPMWGIGAITASTSNPRVMANAARTVAEAIPGITEKLPEAASQITGSAAPKVMSHQNMGETVVHHAVGHAPIMANEAMTKTSPTDLNVNHPALAPWKQTFQQNAAKAQSPGEAEKSHAVTDFILSQRDPAYAAAKQKAADNPEEAKKPDALGMADGGVVPEDENKITEPIPELGSTLEGFAKLLKNGKTESGIPMEQPATPAPAARKPPFNSDFADKLKMFLQSKKEQDNAQSR